MNIVIPTSYLLLGLTLVCGLIRLIIGPDRLNRILAFDLICICIIGIVSVYSIQTDSPHYLEIILAFCLLGFTSTLAFMDALFRPAKKKEASHDRCD